MDRSSKIWLAAGAVFLIGTAAVLVRDRGHVGRVYEFEVEGRPFVTIFGTRYNEGRNLQVSVITWDLAAARKACSVGFVFGKFAPVGAAGRHLWVDRGRTNWDELAVWDLATCEERFDAAHFREQAREPLDFGVGDDRPVDPASGRLFLSKGWALDVDGSVVAPPDDTHATLFVSLPHQRASCRSRRHTPACGALPWCAGEEDGRIAFAQEGELGDAVGPTFASPRLLGSPGAYSPCVRVLTDDPAVSALVRHDGARGPDGATWPAGLARIDAAGEVLWNVPATTLELAGEVISVQRGADDQLWIVAAEGGWRLTGGYKLEVVQLAAADGAVLGRAALP